MSKTRLWMICTSLAIAVMMVAGWFLLVGPQRAKAADLRAQTAAEEAGSAALRTDLDVLTAQSKLLPAKRAQLAKFAQQIPSSPAQPAQIRALQQAATKAGASLVSIAPSSPTPFAASATPGQPAPAAGAVPTAGAPATPATSSTLQSITWTIKVRGSYVHLEQFVANLENLTRVFIVTGYSISPDTTSSEGDAVTCGLAACPLGLELSGQVFTAPPLAVTSLPTSATAIPTAK